jgi:hypothetical protein
MVDMYNQMPRKDVRIFAPSIDVDKLINDQKIKPVEWTENSRDDLLRSIEIIRKRKEKSIEIETANKNEI